MRRLRRGDNDNIAHDDNNAADDAGGSDTPEGAMENEPEQNENQNEHLAPEEEEFADENAQNESDGDVLAASTNNEQETQQQHRQQQQQATFWNAEDDAANEERRREALLGEIQRSQKSNFVHFLMLCLVPTSLLLIVVASVVGESIECDNFPVKCVAEPRSFINAFTSRCICEAVIAEQP
jgi:hypothetical protein